MENTKQYFVKILSGSRNLGVALNGMHISVVTSIRNFVMDFYMLL